MIATAYLDADVARLGDAEPLRTVPVPVPTVPDTVLTEIDYAVDLFQRADRAIVAEADVLGTLVPEVDWFAVRSACCTLVHAALGMYVYAAQARAGRPA